MNEKHEFFRELRKDALEEAKLVLGQNLKPKLLEGKYNYDSNKLARNQSLLHRLISIDEIEFTINNNLSIGDIYDREGKKYSKPNTNEDLQEMWDGEESE